VDIEILASSILVALLSLTLLAKKWRIKIKIAILGGIVIGGVAGFIVDWINLLQGHLHILLIGFLELAFIFLITFLAIIFRFYRNPERIPLETEKVILSPADGKVIYTKKIGKGKVPLSAKGGKKVDLKEITKTDLLTSGAYLIGIDMNILDVHVNRAPIGGRVVLQKHARGKFISLRRQEATIMNERVTTIIDNGIFKVGVIQIASRLVRRIVSYLKEGESVRIGQRIGMIKFGSQVDLVIPNLENLKIWVKQGDQVLAGVSLIAGYS